MKTFSEFITEEIEYYETTLSYLVNEGYVESYEEAEDIYLNLDEASKNTLGKLAWKATKAGAKLAWKGVKAATKAVRDYGSYYPVGSKRRAVSDTIDKVHQATLSDEEKRKRRNAVHRARNTRKGREELEARQKKSQEVSDRWHEQQRKRQERIRARTGRYRNVGAGSRESVNEMKTFSEFIEEAARRQKVLRTHHFTSASSKENIMKSGVKDSPSTGTYHPDDRKDIFYTTPSSRVGSDYGSRRVSLRLVNPKVKSTDSPRDFGKNIKKWMASSSIEDINDKKGKPTSAVDQARDAFKKGAKVVRVPDAHGGFTPKPGAPRGSYIMVDKETANKSIDKNPQPTIRASNKPQRTRTAPKKR